MLVAIPGFEDKKRVLHSNAYPIDGIEPERIRGMALFSS
jgi:hypothetical protein